MFEQIEVRLYKDEPRKSQARDIVCYLTDIHYVGLYDGCDQVRYGKGEFGCPDNPIPVNGVRGEYIYLNRLRSVINGSGYLFHRVCTFDSLDADTPVDVFELVSKSGNEWRQLCFSPYYERRSRKAPSFASLIPITDEKLNQGQKLNLLYWPWEYRYGNGTYYVCRNFPNDLAQLYRKTISNLIEIRPPYYPICWENGVPVWKCDKQWMITNRYLQDINDRIEVLTSEIDEVLNNFGPIDRQSYNEYLDSPRNYYKQLRRNKSWKVEIANTPDIIRKIEVRNIFDFHAACKEFEALLSRYR